MITFKQFLLEAKSAPLYHTTMVSNAENILRTNTLIGDIQRDGRASKLNRKVIFFTRDFRQAQHLFKGMDFVIFQVDQLKLSYRYKIRPIKNWQFNISGSHKPSYNSTGLGNNEFEEIVIANKITNFENYIQNIYISSKGIDEKRYPNLYNHENRIDI